MSLVLDDLPRDPDHLLRMLQQISEVVTQQNASLVSLQAERDTVLAERDAAQAEIEKLRLLIQQLQRGQFGRRSEKLDPISCSSAWKISSRPWLQPRRRRRPRPRGAAPHA